MSFRRCFPRDAAESGLLAQLYFDLSSASRRAVRCVLAFACAPSSPIEHLPGHENSRLHDDSFKAPLAQARTAVDDSSEGAQALESDASAVFSPYPMDGRSEREGSMLSLSMEGLEEYTSTLHSRADLLAYGGALLVPTINCRFP